MATAEPAAVRNIARAQPRPVNKLGLILDIVFWEESFVACTDAVCRDLMFCFVQLRRRRINIQTTRNYLRESKKRYPINQETKFFCEPRMKNIPEMETFYFQREQLIYDEPQLCIINVLIYLILVSRASNI